MMLKSFSRFSMIYIAGFNKHKQPLIGVRHTLDDISNRRPPSTYLKSTLDAPKVAKQLGTLGGGNHFLEVQTPSHHPFMHDMLHQRADLPLLLQKDKWKGDRNREDRKRWQRAMGGCRLSMMRLGGFGSCCIQEAAT